MPHNTPLFRSAEELASLSASERIRYRLVGAKRRYHANDNIAEHVHAGELEELKTEVQGHLQQVLRALVIDTDSDHNTKDTAKRVAKMFVEEVFRGRYVPMPVVTEFPNFSRLNELMIVGPITVRSACCRPTLNSSPSWWRTARTTGPVAGWNSWCRKWGARSTHSAPRPGMWRSRGRWSR